MSTHAKTKKGGREGGGVRKARKSTKDRLLHMQVGACVLIGLASTTVPQPWCY
jgi:hypothetical protein